MIKMKRIKRKHTFNSILFSIGHYYPFLVKDTFFSMVTRHTFFLTKRIAFRLLIYSAMSLDDLSCSFTLR